MRSLLPALLLVSAAAIPFAHADIVTYQVAFSSPGYNAANGHNFPVSGTFTLTFDRSVDTPAVDGQNVFVTKDFTVDSFSYKFSQPVTVGYAYAATYGELYVVGSPDLVNDPHGDPGFGLDFFDINSDPSFPLSNAHPYLGEGTIGDSAKGVEEEFLTADVTVTQLNSPVPEPGSLTLVGTGALGVWAGVRRRIGAAS